MPYERPGAGVYVTATKVHLVNDPATENGFVGVAVKQKARGWSEGLINPESIAIGEKFHIRTKGIKDINVAAGSKGVAIAAAAKGDAVYIKPADDTLTVEPGAAVGDLPYGRVVETPADNRGVATNHLRIDLDQKDTIVPAV